MSVAPDALLSILQLQPPDNSPDTRLNGGAAERIGEALGAAAAAAVGMGDEKRYIQLYQHPITWTYTPIVKVTVPGGGSFDLSLEVKLSLKVDQAVLVLVGGKATAIEPGKGKVEATAKIGGLELCPPATLDLGTLPGSLAI